MAAATAGRSGRGGWRSSTWSPATSRWPTRAATCTRSSTVRSTTTASCGERLLARGHLLRSRGRHRGARAPVGGRGAGDARAPARHVRPRHRRRAHADGCSWPATALGKKPLYWTRRGAAAWSSPPSSRRCGRRCAERPALDPAAHLASFLRWGFVPEGQCILEGSDKLPPGCWLRLDLARGGELAVESATGGWSSRRTPRSRSRTSAVERLRATCSTRRSRLRLRADVPLAVFLSGGLDSGVVTALAARAPARPPARCPWTFADGVSSERDARPGHGGDGRRRASCRCAVDAAAGPALLPELATGLRRAARRPLVHADAARRPGGPRARHRGAQRRRRRRGAGRLPALPGARLLGLPGAAARCGPAPGWPRSRAGAARRPSGGVGASAWRAGAGRPGPTPTWRGGR